MNPLLHSRLARRQADEAAPAAALLRRARVQLGFARAFAELAPFEAARVDDAEARLAAAPNLERAVAEMEASLADVGRLAKAYTVHLVGHGHIDMNWMWSWPETVATTHDTFASALSFMRTDPDLTFSQSQASVYALMERYHPALFEEIKQRVREGRWEVTATQWVEGDKNLVSGESLARHLLYTRRYFEEKFGLSPEDVPVAWEPDTFGHANTVPSILAQGGVRYYYSCRSGGGFDHPRVGIPRPPLFWWEGPDGARLLVNRETTWYNSDVNIGENFALPLVAFAKTTGLRDWLNVFGVGNHGGGPTRREVEYYRETMDWPIFPTVRFGTAKGYFETVEKELPADLPILAHELNYEFTGCYTSQSAIKRANRLGEAMCLDAEAASAIGVTALGIQGGPDLREAWIEILFNQFHDILPGSGVAATRERAMGAFQETAALAGAAKRRFASALASRVDTLSLLPDSPEGDEERARAAKAAPFSAGAGLGAGESGFSPSVGGGERLRPFVVFNPCAWARGEIVSVDVYDADWDPARVVATDETGRAVRAVAVHRSSEWAHELTRYFFAAEDVPALGYRTFLLGEGEPSPDGPKVSTSPNERFKTPFSEFQIDRYGLGVRTSVGQIGDWSLVLERERGMSSWALGKEVERTALAADSYEALGAGQNMGSGNVEGANGALVAVRRARVHGTESRVALRTLVNPLSDRIDFEAEIDWREIGTPARGIPGLTIDFPAQEEAVVFETPFGTIERQAEEMEVPSLRFAHLPKAGITILQDCKHGHGIGPDGVRLRVLRSSYEPDHAPEVGKSKMRYAVVFHATTPSRAELIRLAAAFNHPLLAFPATFQKGDLAPRREFVGVEGPAVLFSLKKGEEGGLILRLVDYDGGDGETTVTLDPALVPPNARAERVDPMERPVDGEARLDGNRLVVRVPRHGFASIKIS